MVKNEWNICNKYAKKRSYFLALLWIVLEKIAKVLLASKSKKRSKRKEICQSFYENI